MDLLDRSLIIRTTNYTVKEMITIISIRAVTEGIELQDDALAEIGIIGARTSLRYCIQLLAPARILAETYGRKVIQYPCNLMGWCLHRQSQRYKGSGRALLRLQTVRQVAHREQGQVLGME